MDERRCFVEGCERLTRTSSADLCEMHRRRVARHGEAGPPNPIKVTRYYVGDHCVVDGCNREACARGYCLLHFKRIQRTGQPGQAEPFFVPGAKDGIDIEGYRRRRIGGRRYKEHRYVMAQMLGRDLLPNENVHHRNGNRTDNRPENLELWVKCQPCGQRAEDQVRWARQILALYGELFPENPMT